MRPSVTTIEPGTRRCKVRGSMFVPALVFVVILMAFVASMGSTVTSDSRETSAVQGRLRQLHLADSGLDAALHDLARGGSGALGSSAAPVALGSGEFWTVVQPNADGSVTIVSCGRAAGGRRAVQGRARRGIRAFDYAIFAGNRSQDPDYVLELGGTGAQADSITGNVYSGGDIDVVGEAAVAGSSEAAGIVTGTPGDGGVSRETAAFDGLPIQGPDIVDVAAQFAAESTYASDDAGGSADQLPATNPAHIFRRNPSDRATENADTVKEDYFLEDPYEVLRTDPAQDGSDPYDISIDDGTGLASVTYYIDGNLWIHNRPTYSFRLKTTPGSGTKVTFLVRGNVYFGDSVRYEDTSADGLAFVALKDPDVPDSGNVYLGDPRAGTLQEMHGFLHAENDFYDLNLDPAGSKVITLIGAMTAGNRVLIDRDYDTGSGVEHSKLEVVWDSRLRDGSLALPYISPGATGPGPVTLEAWLEVPPWDL